MSQIQTTPAGPAAADIDKLFATPDTAAPNAAPATTPTTTPPAATAPQTAARPRSENPDFIAQMEKTIALPGVATMSQNGLVATDMTGLWRIAKMYAASGMVPDSISKNVKGDELVAKVCIILEYASVLKITNMAALQGLCVVRNVVSIWGDLLNALVLNHPKYAGTVVEYTGEKETLTCTVTIKRRLGDGTETFTGTFGIPDALKAGLVFRDEKGMLKGKDAWVSYTRDMLRRRAYSRAARQGFADALCGLASADELTDAEISEQGSKSNEVGDVLRELAQ